MSAVIQGMWTGYNPTWLTESGTREALTGWSTDGHYRQEEDGTWTIRIDDWIGKNADINDWVYSWSLPREIPRPKRMTVTASLNRDADSGHIYRPWATEIEPCYLAEYSAKHGMESIVSIDSKCLLPEGQKLRSGDTILITVTVETEDN